MRRLHNTYWDKFKKRDANGKIIRDGLLFEDLILELLKLEYPGEWKRTKKSHDDNRDFYLVTKESKIWAECKNYENSIALDTIAPTLVMAQVYSANKIIFFSYSKINPMAHRKLYNFAAATQKEIEIQEEELLDLLVIKNSSFLSKKFRVNTTDIIIEEKQPEIDVQFSIIQDPIWGTYIEDDDIIPYHKMQKIQYNNSFEVLISFDFNYIIPDLSIEICSSEKKGCNSNYVLLDKTRLDLLTYTEKINLNRVTGYVRSLLIKPLFYTPDKYLPMFDICIYSGKNIIKSLQTPLIQVKSIWNKQTALIGTEYRCALKTLAEKVLDSNHLGCLLVYGVSGTGKTRLLKESLDYLLMSKYRVINFIGKEKDSARILLKELIYFIYEIPREEIFQYLNENNDEIQDTKANYAIHLISSISHNISDNEVIDLIENHFEIIYEKMSSERIALVIDNIQDFGVPLRIFLEKYIGYSIHQARSNRSVLLLSLNIDKADNSMILFKDSILEISNDYPAINVHKTSGFSQPSQAVIFLKELLNEKSERFDKELEQVVEAYSKTPYYLWQFVYNLLETNIAYCDENNKCHILKPDEFFNYTLQLYDPNELLKKRWKMLISRNLFEEKEYLRILSLISLIDKVNDSKILEFNLKEECAQILYKYNYLRKTDTGYYVFDHDIIEKFLLDFYGKKYFAILHHVKENNLKENLTDFPLTKHFFNVFQDEVSINDIKEAADYIWKNKPPLLFIKYILELLISKINKHRDEFQDKEKWLLYSSRTCNILRNSIGIEETLKYYESINSIIEQDNLSNFISIPYFRYYIDTYSGLLHHLRQSSDAIKYLKGILAEVENIMNKADDDVTNSLYSMIYNRLLINYREKESKQARLDLLNVYNKSIDYANRIKKENLKNEFLYLNQSDLGYIYYSTKDEKEQLLKIWNECKKYTPDILPQKILNYYRKRVQLGLINQELDEASHYIELIRNYLYESNYNAEQGTFSMFCLMAECICLIVKDPIQNYEQIKKNLIESMRLSKLRGGKKDYEILNIKAIAAYYNNDYLTMEESFNKACDLIDNAEPTMHLTIKQRLLRENRINAYKSDYIACSILCTPDEKFNFLPVV